MFYKLNSLSGRVGPASQSTAYAPAGLNPVVQESPKIVFQSATVQAVPTDVAPSQVLQEFGLPKTEDPKGFVPGERPYIKVMQLQKAMTADNGLLVWQRRGFRDRSLMWVTLGLMGVGLIISANALWTMSWPRKKEE